MYQPSIRLFIYQIFVWTLQFDFSPIMLKKLAHYKKRERETGKINFNNINDILFKSIYTKYYLHM